MSRFIPSTFAASPEAGSTPPPGRGAPSSLVPLACGSASDSCKLLLFLLLRHPLSGNRRPGEAEPQAVLQVAVLQVAGPPAGRAELPRAGLPQGAAPRRPAAPPRVVAPRRLPAAPPQAADPRRPAAPTRGAGAPPAAGAAPIPWFPARPTATIHSTCPARLCLRFPFRRRPIRKSSICWRMALAAS